MDHDDFDEVEMGGGHAPPPRATSRFNRQMSTGEGDIDLDNDSGPPPARATQPSQGWGDAPAPVARVNSSMTTEAVGSNMDDGGPQFGRRKGGPASSIQTVGQDGKFDNEVVTDIAEIPDVEEELREDITTKVAEAPNVRSNRVQALQELDQQIMFQLPTATGDGIDLSLLTNALSPQEKVAEPDAHWEFEVLFSDVSSEMQNELEPVDKEEGEEGEEGEDTEDNAGRKRDEADTQAK